MPIPTETLKRLRENDPSLVELHFQKLSNDDLSNLIKVLEKNTAVKRLRLNNNGIDNVGIKTIAIWLATNQSLEVLNLSSNHFTGIGVNDLVEALKRNTTLKELHLFGNEIYDTEMGKFLKVLEVNTSLNRLDLNGNPASLESHLAIINKLKDNQRKRAPAYQFIRTLADVAKARSHKHKHPELSIFCSLPDEILAYIFSLNVFFLKNTDQYEQQSLASFILRNWRFLLVKEVQLTKEASVSPYKSRYIFFFDHRDKRIQQVLSICMQKHAMENLDKNDIYHFLGRALLTKDACEQKKLLEDVLRINSHALDLFITAAKEKNIFPDNVSALEETGAVCRKSEVMQTTCN